MPATRHLPPRRRRPFRGAPCSRFPARRAARFLWSRSPSALSAGAAALTWLFVYGQHANPGERYGLLSDTCGGQYVAAYDLGEGTADRKGDVTIVAPNLDISSTALGVWVLVYRLADGTPLGGVLGPLTGNGAKTFRSVPPCPGPSSAASTTGPAS